MPGKQPCFNTACYQRRKCLQNRCKNAIDALLVTRNFEIHRNMGMVCTWHRNMGMGSTFYLAVEICHRGIFPVGKKFENQQNNQRSRSAWVRQSDFGKRELNSKITAITVTSCQ